MIALLLIWIYSALEGITDGVLWSRKGHEAFKGNEHIVLFGSRVVVFVLAFLKISWVLLLLCALMFPFIHAGFYYETRKKISNGETYPDGWKSEPSEDSSARLNFSFKQRTWLFAGAFSVTIIYLILSN